ncbi:hypothetical protein C3411_12620 [Citrobacter freundii complex sp. CFNIH5]|nr:hypothetical protein C3411_12620 [Citrobacter freundii complex sp. CFNIH5]
MSRLGESRQQTTEYPEMRFSLAGHVRKMAPRLKKDSDVCAFIFWEFVALSWAVWRCWRAHSVMK